MTDIKWGPAIAVDGKQPEWLGDEDLMQWSRCGHVWYGAGHPANRYFLADDYCIGFIRLPADHPYYRQTEAAIPEGMKVWHGGDAAPADWDSEKPIAVIDDGTVSIRYGHRWDWSREPVNAYGHKLLRVVAYTPAAAPIDWSGELEAVHEDGRVEAVTLMMVETDDDGDFTTDQYLSDHRGVTRWWTREGRPSPEAGATNVGWRIRNVPQPTPQADTKPDSDMGITISPDLTARMEALVRKLATWTWVAHTNADKDYAEARAIVALLPEPVDPDLIEARRLVAEKFDGGTKSLAGDAVRAGARDHAHDVQLAYDCIKRGRALALAGEKEA